jgi:hypothetical protein
MKSYLFLFHKGKIDKGRNCRETDLCNNSSTNNQLLISLLTGDCLSEANRHLNRPFAKEKSPHPNLPFAFKMQGDNQLPLLIL